VWKDRSGAWLKVKSSQRQEFIVIGWCTPEYWPDDIRGLFLATEEDGRLVYRGAVGTGFANRTVRGFSSCSSSSAPTIARTSPACRAGKLAPAGGSSRGSWSKSNSPRSRRTVRSGTHPIKASAATSSRRMCT